MSVNKQSYKMFFNNMMSLKKKYKDRLTGATDKKVYKDTLYFLHIFRKVSMTDYDIPNIQRLHLSPKEVEENGEPVTVS